MIGLSTRHVEIVELSPLCVKMTYPLLSQHPCVGGRLERSVLCISTGRLAKGSIKDIHPSAFKLPPFLLFPSPHISLKLGGGGSDYFCLFLAELGMNN